MTCYLSGASLAEALSKIHVTNIPAAVKIVEEQELSYSLDVHAKVYNCLHGPSGIGGLGLLQWCDSQGIPCVEISHFALDFALQKLRIHADRCPDAILRIRVASSEVLGRILHECQQIIQEDSYPTAPLQHLLKTLEIDVADPTLGDSNDQRNDRYERRFA